jgi:hypothetical protein
MGKLVVSLRVGPEKPIEQPLAQASEGRSSSLRSRWGSQFRQSLCLLLAISKRETPGIQAVLGKGTIFPAPEGAWSGFER